MKANRKDPGRDDVYHGAYGQHLSTGDGEWGDDGGSSIGDGEVIGYGARYGHHGDGRLDIASGYGLQARSDGRSALYPYIQAAAVE